MQPRMRISSKRPYHATMGLLLDDASLLAKKRKVLFDGINTQLDSLIELIQDTGCNLGASGDDYPLIVRKDYLNSRGDSYSPSLVCKRLEDANYLLQLDVQTQCDNTDLLTSEEVMRLNELASAVKSLESHKKVNRSYKEFLSGFNKFGKSLFRNNSRKNYEMLSPVKLDEKLVCHMIGMHLLHYGLFDVYEELKRDSTRIWGKDNKGIVEEVIVDAYKTLHFLLNEIKANKTDSVVEWVKNQCDVTNLHIERFNSLLINLYKIRFLKDLFVCENNAVERSDLKITLEKINEMKSSGLTSLWKLHNDEIGRLITQVLLGENVPILSEFEDLKNRTVKMFTRLFCENGFLVKRSKRRGKCYESDLDVSNCRTAESNKESEIRRELSILNDRSICDPIFNLDASSVTEADNFDSFDFIRRTVKNDQNKTKLHDNQKRQFWLDALNSRHLNRPKNTTGHVENGKKRNLVKKGWLFFDGTDTCDVKGYPRMSFHRLRADSLSVGLTITFVKEVLLGRYKKANQKSLYSKAALISMLSDPETRCRQLVPIEPETLGIDYDFSESELIENTESIPIRESDEWQSQSGDGGTSTTVLIASANDEPDDNFLGVSSVGSIIESYPFLRGSQQSSDDITRSQRGMPPTFSLTLFAGSSLLRDNRLSSQLLEGDLVSQRLLGNPSGSRIRIRFPPRNESSLEPSTTSQSRRSGSRGLRIHPYDHDTGNADSSATSPTEGDSNTNPRIIEGESYTNSYESSNINLRDILRMIMRGFRGDTIQSPGAVVRLRGTSRNHPMLTGSRSEHDSQSRLSERDGQTNGKPQNSRPLNCVIQDYAQKEFVRVFLPHESPICVVTCAGHVTFPYLLEVSGVLFKERCEVSSKVGMWLKSSQQLPVESDLGPAFHFHSYLTCAVSKDQTSSENLPIMLSCGHVICKICFDRLSGKRRKRQFKCPLCPAIVEPGQTRELYLDWNSNVAPGTA